MAYKVINGKLTKVVPTVKDQRKLAGFYWGYKADQGELGFEFTNHQLTKVTGMPMERALEIGAIIKKTATEQWQGVMRKDPKYLEGKTKEEFIDEEFDRLLWVIDEVRSSTQISYQKYMEHAMIACCAISTLVAAGRIPQDTWNGDSFMEEVDLELA
jgi:hypothetical protein